MIILCLFGTTFVLAIVGGVLWMKAPTGDKALSAGPPQILEFRLPRILDEGEFAFAAARGRVTIVNFWATWCAPCQREFPTFLEAAGKLGGDVLWVLVSVDEDRAEILKFLKRFDARKANIEVLWDATSSVSRTFGTVQLPESYIFDKDRRFDRKVLGYVDWNSRDVREYLLKLKGG